MARDDMFPLLIAVRPQSVLNVRSAPWGSVIGVTTAQDYRVVGYRLDDAGQLWLEIFWTPDTTAFIAGWYCTLVMLAPDT